MKRELGKIIRDSVHGDIFIEDRYLKIVNTSEFQRLRRINQLSVGNLVFPSAQHTRFSHSIGTFYLMKEIINHISSQLENINIKVDEKDKDLALLVALLHDIGHGPFSHAFESVLNKNHEEWTCDIILGNTNINKAIIENFGSEYPEKLVSFIKKQEVNKEESIDNGNINLFFVIQSLISSQLDADRLDYLVRDSKGTGVVFGDIDLSRIIKSIRITEYEDNIYVCIPEKNVLDIKSYLLARDNMHDAVYFHPTKCELEKIIELIFKRCKELVIIDPDFENLIPKNLLPFINDGDISLEKYLYLDDYMIITFFKQLLSYDDFTLKKLCDAIINRKKFNHIEILNNQEENIDKFLKGLDEILFENSKLYKKDDNKYFWTQTLIDHVPYKGNKEKIYVLVNDGTIKQLDEVTDGLNLRTKKIYTTINLEILLSFIEDEKKEDTKKQVEKLITEYSNRNHIEIEKKFILKDTEFNQILKLIEEFGMNVTREDKKLQYDIYYDNKDRFLFNNDISFRIRKNGDNLCATIKTPASKGENSERFEYEFEVDSYDISNVLDCMKVYSNEEIIEKIKECNQVLKIKNNREIARVDQNDVSYEIAYDKIEYIDNSEQTVKKENELEIELKSNYYHRVHLKMLSDYLCKKANGLTLHKKSKYKRGMEALDKNRNTASNE